MFRLLSTALPIVLLTSVASWASQSTFECRNAIGGREVSMNVVQQGADFYGTLEGATFKGPVFVKRDIKDRGDALNTPGIREILREIRVTSAEWANVSQVVIFTYGNFEDDGAGVRGASFLDSNGSVLKKGMFFGWGGPLSCR